MTAEGGAGGETAGLPPRLGEDLSLPVGFRIRQHDQRDLHAEEEESKKEREEKKREKKERKKKGCPICYRYVCIMEPVATELCPGKML